jgi:hypothetical protein
LKTNLKHLTINQQLKMECVICFGSMKRKYQLTGCSHAICLSCAHECKDRSDINSIEVEGNFRIYTDDIYQPMACPLCRQVEKKLSVDDFKTYYPDMYDEWLQLELNCDEDGFSYCDADEYITTTRTRVCIPFHPKYSTHNRVPKPVTWNRKKIQMKGKRKI